ncbi:serine hydrolase domain-containing protein [Duganella guangzhouensis]|nr:serine hydrolase domain-containing protein [Duganella guangzhouensis]
MFIRHFILKAAVLWLALDGAVCAAALPPEDAARVDAVVAATLQARQAPGAVLAIVRDGEVVYRKAYGAVSTASLFEIGSLTKQMAAAAVLQLAAQGKLALDDRVGKYVPEYPAAVGVTIRQLLQQTSGLPDFAGTPEFAANGTTRPTDFEGIVASVRALPMEFAPGERWKYSNTNYALLGHIIERVSGEDFDSYLSAHILRPAGMRTVSTLGKATAADGKALGYSSDGNSLQPAAMFQNSWIGAAGNLVASVDDLIAWNRALASSAWLPAMRTRAVLNDGDTAGYGYGLFLDHQAGRDRVWHGGGTLGFSTSSMLYPDEKLWIIALVNDGDVNASAMTAFIYDALHGIRHEAAAGEVPAVNEQLRALLKRAKQGELSKKLQAQLDVYGRPEDLLYAGRDGDAYRYRARFGAQWLQLRLLPPTGQQAVALTATPE